MFCVAIISKRYVEKTNGTRIGRFKVEKFQVTNRKPPFFDYSYIQPFFRRGEFVIMDFCNQPALVVK